MSKNPSFIKNVLVMVSGTAIAQIIGFLAIPIITRMYGPESYGILGTFIAITGLVMPIAALSYPIAIVLPKSNKVAEKIVTTSLYITVLMSILSFILIIFLDDFISSIFNLESIKYYLLLLPFVILFSGLFQTLQQWYIRKEKFNRIANSTVLQALVHNGILILAGLVTPFTYILIFMETSKNMLKTIFLGFNPRELLRFLKLNKVKMSKLILVTRKYKDFPLFRAPEVLINSSSQAIPILLLSSFFGPATAGFYTLSRTVLGAPTQLIGKSVGDVIYPKITQIFNSGKDISRILYRSTLYLALIGLLPFGIVIIFGPDLFSFIFGEEWYMAGEFARWLSLWSYCLFINIPAVRTLPVLSAQAFHLKFSIVLLIVRTLAMLVAYYLTKDELQVVKYAAVSSAIFNMLLILVTFKISRENRIRV